MTKPLNIVAISGSLREASFNTGLLKAAAELAPETLTVSLLAFHDLPFLNPDVPATNAVDGFKAAISEADGLLIATPEYNYSVPGGLKNALDWASRPAYQSPMFNKPVGVLSASPGMVGGARAQSHLKHILLGMGSQVFPYPEFLLSQAGGKFDDGALVDETTRSFLTKYLEAYAAWVSRCNH